VSKKRAAAEEVLTINELAETEALMFATEKRDDIGSTSSFDPHWRWHVQLGMY